MGLFERVRRGRRRQRGQAVVELAIIAPVMIILLLAVADLGRVFHSEVTVANAARAGALEAAKNPTSYQDGLACDASTNRVVCAVMRETSGSFLSLTPADIDLVCDPDPCAEALGNTVTVTVRTTFSLITPLLSAFMGGQTFPLDATSSAQISVVPTVPGSSPSPTPTPTPSPSPSPSPDPSSSPSAAPSPSPSVEPSPSPSPNPCIAPVADFSITPTSGKKKKTTFQFTDLSTTSTDCPLTWSWNFGDGGGASSTSTLQNPTHVYDSQGTYTVTLVVSNLGGSHMKTRTVTVTP
jgi:Flp pilus assembly protein TadG